MPPASTVESAFVLLDRASGPARGIKREFKGLREEAERAGDAIDRIGGVDEVRRLEALSRETRGLAGAVRSVKDEARGANPTLLAYTNRLRTADRETNKLVASTDRLAVSLRTLGTIDARPQVHLDGIAEARAELAALRRELRSFGRSSPTATVGVRRGGAIPPSGGGLVRHGAGMAGSGGGGLRSVGVGSLSLRPSLGLGVLAAGLPIAQSLGGAAGAGAATLGGAGLGAGAVGATGYAVAAAGVGALAAVIAPAKQGLKNLADAQTKYNATIADYGRKSKEAARARWELNQAEAAAPAGGAGLLRQRNALGQDWNRLTRPGQAALTGAGAHFLRGVRGRAPFLAGQANRVSKSAAAQGTQFGDFLLAPAQMRVVRQLTNEFSRDLGYAENTAEHLVTAFGNIARASLPFFHEGAKFVDHWTDGWAKSTGDITATRRQIGSYVDDLKTVARVGGHAAELVRDLFEPARGPGRGMLQDFDRTLVRWDAWAQRNPGKIQQFFKDSVSETEKLAKFTGEVVEDVHQLADLLGPVVGNFAQLGSIAGGAGLLLPTALRVGAGRFVGQRAGGGGAGGSGGGAGGAVAGGAGAAVAIAGTSYLAARSGGVAGRYSIGTSVARPEMFDARYGGFAPESRYAMPVSQIGARTTAAGAARGALGRGAAATGRFVGPALAISGALGAATASGPWYERLTSGLSAASLGTISPVLGPESARQGGMSAAAGQLAGLPDGGDPKTLRSNISRIQGQIAAQQKLLPQSTDSFWTRAFNVNPWRKEPISRSNVQGKIAALEKALTGEQGTLHDAQTARTQILNEQSKLHGASLGDSLQQAFVTRTTRGPKSGRLTPQAAMDNILHSTTQRMSGMKDAGASVLGESMLAWTKDMEKANPKLKGSVDQLAHYIEKRWSRLGKHIQVVDGQILTGTSSEWRSISRALSDPAEQALEKVANAFTAIQRQAVGSLMSMGYTRKEANAIVQGRESGGSAGAQNAVNSASISRGDTGATRSRIGGGSTTSRTVLPSAAPGGSFGPISSAAGPFGDAIGADIASRGAPAGRVGGQAAGTSGSLMGADADLMPYAQLGASFGSHVTSGLRPGAITVSGNPSFHGSGDAIDMSGGDMMGLARTLASQYGSGLEELIYSPLGWGIKNGRRVPNSFFGADVIAQHYSHVHVADVDPRTGMGTPSSFQFSPDTAGPGMQSISLSAPASGLGGIPGALADAATAAFTAGLMQKINGGGGGGGGGSTLGGTGSGWYFTGDPAANPWSPAEIAALASRHGLPGETFAQIAHGESNYLPFVQQRDPGDGNVGFGFWQLTPHAWGANSAAMKRFNQLGGIQGMLNVDNQAEMAAYLYHAAGNRVSPWRGTRYLTGAQGDGLGRMRSRVQLAGASGARGGGVAIHNRVTVHAGEGDTTRVTAIVERRLKQFAQGVRREIESGPEKRPGAMG